MELNVSLVITRSFYQITKGPADIGVNKEQNFEDTITIAWNIVYGLISVPATVGNILILLCLSRFKDDKSGIHILVGNLSIADLMVGSVLLPYCIIVESLGLDSDKYVCLIKTSLTVFTVGGACIGLLFVAVDRFCAICFPLRYHVILTTGRLTIMLISGWCYIAFLSYLPVSGWNFYDRTQPDTCFYGDVVTPIYHKVVNSNFILLLTTNVVLYITVMKIAINRSKSIYPAAINGHGPSNVSIKKNKRDLYKVKTMAMVQGLFALCWLPYTVIATVLLFCDNHFLKEVQYWTLVPGILNSAFNWLIYGYRNKLLGNQMKLYLRCSSESLNKHQIIRKKELIPMVFTLWASSLHCYITNFFLGYDKRIWLETRDLGHSDVCVKCRLGSACAIRAG